uniref:Uncharacterized protein n=1 Tax=Physcomitrium patens TaxID=3218 RepID=A0A7I3ZF08_PHYPA
MHYLKKLLKNVVALLQVEVYGRVNFLTPHSTIPPDCSHVRCCSHAECFTHSRRFCTNYPWTSLCWSEESIADFTAILF